VRTDQFDLDCLQVMLDHLEAPDRGDR
jgi:hypothetical protein